MLVEVCAPRVHEPSDWEAMRFRHDHILPSGRVLRDPHCSCRGCCVGAPCEGLAGA